MIFVGGTNFLVHLCEGVSVKFSVAKPPEPAFRLARMYINYGIEKPPGTVIRHYWFGSYRGNDPAGDELRQFLRKHDFEPVLFQQIKGREKGVDIALTMEMLVNAFNQNFDVGILVAGDEDYAPLVKEVNRYGPQVHGAFFEHGLSANLRIAFDKFHNFGQLLNDPVKGKRLQPVIKELQGLST